MPIRALTELRIHGTFALCRIGGIMLSEYVIGYRMLR